MGWVEDKTGIDVTPDLGSGSDLWEWIEEPFEDGIDFGEKAIQKTFEWIYDPSDTPAYGDQAGVLLNRRANDAYIPIVYGERRVGGTVVFTGVSGTDDEFLHMVMVVSEGEIDSINDVYIDDIISTDAKYSGLITITKYIGTETQAADSTLVSEFTDWTSSAQGKGVAYVYIRFKYDKEAFRGTPKITCDVKGRKVEDHRTSPVTTSWSANPALCIYDYLVNAKAGKALAPSLIDIASFNTAANYCDGQIVQDNSSPQILINRFECNGVIDTGVRVLSNLSELRKTCRGHLTYFNGKYALIIDKDESSVYSLNVDNIVGGWSITGQDKKSRYNRIKAEFVNPERNWQPDIAPFDSTTYRTSDNESLLEKSVNIPFETNYYRALRYATFVCNKSRNALTVSLITTREALQVEPGQVVDITHDYPGWTAELFRVVDIEILEGGNVRLTLNFHDTNTYNFATPAVIDATPLTDLPNPYTVNTPSGLSLASGEDHLLLGADGSIVSRIFASWAAPSDPFIDGYEIEAKKSTDSEYSIFAVTDRPDTTEVYLGPVEDGVNYDVRVRAKNTLQYASDYIVVTNHTVIGKTTPPPDVSTFLVQRQADGTREFKWSLTTPPVDLAGFKIRYALSASPEPVWEDMAELHTGLLTASPFETNQLAAGTYTAGIKAVDTTGNESTNALIITSTLGDPRVKASLLTQDEFANGWPGTKTNCWVDTDGFLVATDQDDWASFATTSPQTTWADWTSWARNPNSPITYETDILDAGIIAVFTPFITVSGEGSITVEERHADALTSPESFTAYATAGTQLTTRYIQFKVTVTNASALAQLKQMYINLDADITEETIEDLDTSTIGSPVAAGDLRLPITKNYALITSVQLALQNTGGGWSWEVIDKNPTLGPRIKIYNSTPALADATIDAVIKGVAS